MRNKVPHFSGPLTTGLNQIKLKESKGAYPLTISRPGFDSFTGTIFWQRN